MISKYNLRVFIYLFSLFFAGSLLAQEKIDPVENAPKQYDSKNYKAALRDYLELIKKE